MKKILYIVALLVVVGMTCISCDDYETYEQQRDYERSKISSFINNPPMGEIKGQKITVISEAQFLKDTVTDLSKNEFVLFEDGVYMQIVRRGCGSVLKSGESATVISRFKEYNINGDSLNWWNDAPHQENWYEKYDVTKYSGTWYGRFTQGSVVYYLRVYDVPAAWLKPLDYIKLGRPESADDEIAKVRLIVPNDQGFSYAQNMNNGIFACYYEITYERGI